MSTPALLDRFLTLSGELTGYKRFELYGTGQAQAYFDTVERIVGTPRLTRLLDSYDAVAGGDPDEREESLRRDLLSDPELGPVARNIVKLWFVGIWYQLPLDWTDAYGVHEGDTTFTVSAQAYTEGLIWPAIGANPPGAKAPGFGSWADPPRIPAPS